MIGRAAANGHRVLERLYIHPVVSVRNVKGLTDKTYSSANDLVSHPEEHGIVKEITGQVRNRKFMYQSYVNLFHDGEFESGA